MRHGDYRLSTTQNPAPIWIVALTTRIVEHQSIQGKFKIRKMMDMSNYQKDRGSKPHRLWTFESAESMRLTTPVVLINGQ
eukprot:scaffold61301_cov45-Attheya_sp.AAC.8